MKCTLSLSLRTVCNEFILFFFVSCIHRILRYSHLDITTYSLHHKVDGEWGQQQVECSSSSSPAAVWQSQWWCVRGGTRQMEVNVFSAQTFYFWSFTSLLLSTDALYSHCRFHHRRELVSYWCMGPIVVWGTWHPVWADTGGPKQKLRFKQQNYSYSRLLT